MYLVREARLHEINSLTRVSSLTRVDMEAESSMMLGRGRPEKKR